MTKKVEAFFLSFFVSFSSKLIIQFSTLFFFLLVAFITQFQTLFFLCRSPSSLNSKPFFLFLFCGLHHSIPSPFSLCVQVVFVAQFQTLFPLCAGCFCHSTLDYFSLVCKLFLLNSKPFFFLCACSLPNLETFFLFCYFYVQVAFIFHAILKISMQVVYCLHS